MKKLDISFSTRIKLLALPCFLSLNLVFFFALCSEVTAQEQVSDPLEGFNRVVFSFNDTVDEYLLEPAAIGYDFIVPDPVESSIANFFRNLKSPVYIVNDIAQFRFHDFAVHTSRFLINSSIGVLGLFDVAAYFDLEHSQQDFGLTLGRWGVSPGPYLVLPILGPSSLRDTTGLVFDYGLDPRSYTFAMGFGWEEQLIIDFSERGIELLNTRSGLLNTVDSAKEAALDYYLFVRSAYSQRRAALVQGSNEPTDVNDSNSEDEEELYIFEDDE